MPEWEAPALSTPRAPTARSRVGGLWHPRRPGPPFPLPVHYLTIDLSEGADGVTTLEAMASTAAEQHAAVLEEVQVLLDWAWRHFGRSHGPVEDGLDWDHDLQVTVEAGQWHAVTLTLSASPAFVEAFTIQFGDPRD